MQAFGQSYLEAKGGARERSKDAMVAQQMMAQAEENRQKQEEERQRRIQMEQMIAQLPPEQQAMARMMPDKFFGAQIEQQFAGQGDGFTLGEGQVRYDANGNQIASGPAKSPSASDKPQIETFFDEKSGQEYKAQWDGEKWVPIGGLKAKTNERASATQLKELWSSEDEIPQIDSTIDALSRAKELNNKTFTGTTAGVRGWAGTALPGASALIDEDAAKATREFGQIMSFEAIKNMSQTLKGATTDRELAQFVEILANPSTPPEIREKTIDRMLTLAERMKQIKAQRVQELRGSEGVSSPMSPPSGKTSDGVPWSIE
jgi:hypothetical protein